MLPPARTVLTFSSPVSISPAGATTARSCCSRSSPSGLTVTAALRLPQAPLRQQFALVAPHLAGLDLLVFDQSGLGDAAAELLPKTPPHVGVCLIGGDRPLTRSAQGDRLIIGKSWLIQRLGAAMRSGALTVAERAPGRDLLRKELAQFVFKPGARGRIRLEAARGHDDLVIAAALAVLAANLWTPSVSRSGLSSCER